MARNMETRLIESDEPLNLRVIAEAKQETSLKEICDMTDDQKYKEILREIGERIKTDEILRCHLEELIERLIEAESFVC